MLSARAQVTRVSHSDGRECQETSTSTITLAEGLDLPTGGGDDATITAAGIAPNSGTRYGFGGDTLILTDGTTTVSSGQKLESGPLTVQGGDLVDDGTVGESTYGEETTLSPTTLTGGSLTGTGAIAGALTNSGGTLAPGPVPGSLTVAGEYKQEAGGTLAIGIAGTTPGTGFDQLLLGGHSAILGGTLSLADEGGFAPAIGNTFKVISGASTREGGFAAVAGASAALYGLEYNPTAPP
jgi:hypothetical protein